MLSQPTVITNDVVVMIGAVGSMLTILTGTIIAITALMRVLAEMVKLVAAQEETKSIVAETKTIAKESKEIVTVTHNLVNSQSELLKASIARESHAAGMADEKAASNERELVRMEEKATAIATIPPSIIVESAEIVEVVEKPRAPDTI